MKQYKLKLTVNKGRRKRAAPNYVVISVTYANITTMLQSKITTKKGEKNV